MYPLELATTTRFAVPLVCDGVKPPTVVELPALVAALALVADEAKVALVAEPADVA
jgi:hypothetical protein